MSDTKEARERALEAALASAAAKIKEQAREWLHENSANMLLIVERDRLKEELSSAAKRERGLREAITLGVRLLLQNATDEAREILLPHSSDFVSKL